MGWDFGNDYEGKQEFFYVHRDGVYHTMIICSLAEEDPVGFSNGLGILDSVEYVVICNNLKSKPNLAVLESGKVREMARKDGSNEKAYWLEAGDYKTHGIGFEKIFG